MFGPSAHLFGAIIQLLPAAGEVYKQISDALEDGEVSAEEARALGIEAANRLGNIQIRVRGKDILHMAAQREIMGGLGRISRQLVLALRK